MTEKERQKSMWARCFATRSDEAQVLSATSSPVPLLQGDPEDLDIDHLGPTESLTAVVLCLVNYGLSPSTQTPSDAVPRLLESSDRSP
jgi:hypothetical protein